VTFLPSVIHRGLGVRVGVHRDELLTVRSLRSSIDRPDRWAIVDRQSVVGGRRDAL